MLLIKFGGQSPKRCELYLGATGTVANEKGSHVPLISAIVKVSESTHFSARRTGDDYRGRTRSHSPGLLPGRQE